MTIREATIVSCYTGYFIGSLGDIYKYLSNLEGRDVYTHEIPLMTEKHKERIKQDFVSIKVSD